MGLSKVEGLKVLFRIMVLLDLSLHRADPGVKLMVISSERLAMTLHGKHRRNMRLRQDELDYEEVEETPALGFQFYF